MKHLLTIFILLVSVLIAGQVSAQSSQLKKADAQTEPLLAPDAGAAVPTCDGVGDDDCWQGVPWQSIDQQWIPLPTSSPYTKTVDDSDFKGQFKVIWSSETNRLYFLAETTDDVFIDGYTHPDDGYPNYDILEVFIDQDMSGGRHVFDTDPNGAENAFSYHIVITAPEDGATTSDKVVCDIDGTGWGAKTIPDYADHLPDFMVKRVGDTYTWEFSLIVYDDTYDDGATEAEVTLALNDEIGIAVAYCENDQDDGSRDFFFGSQEPNLSHLDNSNDYNYHWEYSDDYGTLTLVDELVSVDKVNSREAMTCYPNPAADMLEYRFASAESGLLTINILSLTGQNLWSKTVNKSRAQHRETIDLTQLEAGIYFITSKINGLQYSQKLTVVR